MTQVTSDGCVSCGAPQADNYCANCGEKRVTTHDYSIAHFAEHVVETLTHFDIKSFRALRVLALQPGELTRDYLDGRRKPHIGPIQLFVILNVVFALLGGQTFRVSLSSQNSPPFAGAKRALVAQAQARVGLDDGEFQKEFEHESARHAKSWIFVMIPMFALVFAALFGFRRYFFEHLIFSTHVHAFILGWLIVAGITTAWMLRLIGGAARQYSNAVVTVVILAGLLTYLYAAIRRTSGGGRFSAAARALTMTVLWIPILEVYRRLLFFITIEMMR
jgi:hypothetical protein